VDEKGFWVLVCSVFTLMLASALIPKLAARYLSDARGHSVTRSCRLWCS
jgi:hypothetical protein